MIEESTELLQSCVARLGLVSQRWVTGMPQALSIRHSSASRVQLSGPEQYPAFPSGQVTLMSPTGRGISDHPELSKTVGR